jgi:hypothetical protein
MKTTRSERKKRDLFDLGLPLSICESGEGVVQVVYDFRCLVGNKFNCSCRYDTPPTLYPGIFTSDMAFVRER